MRRWELALFERSPERVLQALERRTKVREEAECSVFLSHAPEDQPLVRATVNFIASHGVKVHVDWVDGGASDESPEVVKARSAAVMEESQKFIFLASPRGLRSSWGPCTLGASDGMRGTDHIALLPIQERGDPFPVSPYFALYPSIQKLDQAWVVVRPSGEVGGNVGDWLRA